MRLELRLLADVGIVGLPNVGKSTLLATATRAQPRIGDYPFTTLEPQLGVVEIGYDWFVLADIPGLVEGAHEGAGLGIQFLRHIQRTGLLLHVVAGDSMNPEEDIRVVDQEIRLYAAKLADLRQIVVVNKADIPAVAQGEKDLEGRLSGLGRPVFLISAKTGEGVQRLMEAAWRALQEERVARQKQGQGWAAFYPMPRRERVVRREESVFVLMGAGVPNLVMPRQMSAGEQAEILRERLRRAGWQRIIERAGVQPGDVVRAGAIEFVW